MAALRSRCGHYIFALWFLLLFFLSFYFPRITSAVADWMSTILPHMVWPYCEFRNARLKRAARGLLKYRTQKFAISVPSHKFVGLYLRN